MLVSESYIIAKKAENMMLFKDREEFSEGMRIINVRGNIRSLRKLARDWYGNDIIIKNPRQFPEKAQAYIKKYDAVCAQEMLSVLDKTLILAAQKYKAALPAEEIYILSDPISAAAIILKIKGMARLFTVVSPIDSVGKMYDELYFKYGAVIRHIPYIGSCTQHAVIIKNNGEKDSPHIQDGIYITLDRTKPDEKNVVTAADICINDKRTDAFEKALEIRGGAGMYKFLGILPDNESFVDINTKCGEIFLLDTQLL